MPNFLCIGDIMLDVSVVIDSEIYVEGDTQAIISTQGGGAAANVATWLASLGSEVFLCSRVGDDPNGQFLHSDLDHYGVRHSDQRFKGEKSGVVVILVNELGERTMFPDSGANSGLCITDLPPLDNFNAAYLSGYALINPKSRTNVLEMIGRLKEQRIPIVLDPGTVGALRNVSANLLGEWLALADLLILNEEEALYLGNDKNLERALVNLSTSTPLVVVKRGEKGVVAIFEAAVIVEIPAEVVNVIDTTGAGDSFTAGFIFSWFGASDLKMALKQGISLASICISNIGARPPRICR